MMVQPLISPSSSPPSSSNAGVVKAAVISTVITLAIAGFLFCFYLRRLRRRRESGSHRRFESEESGMKHGELRNVGGEVKGLIVNENGRDILYLKDTESRAIRTFPKIFLNPSVSVCKDQFQEVHPSSKPAAMAPLPPTRSPEIEALPAPPPPPPLPPPAQRGRSLTALPEKRIVTPPPPPPRSGGFNRSRLPPIPRGKTNFSNKASAPTDQKTESSSLSPAKLKPLHWDKVVASVDHSMVWNEINDSSIRFDDDLIETLFGYTNGIRTTQRNGILTIPANPNATPSARIFILDQRKSQNTAIVMKSLGISREEIADALVEGHELGTEVLEKLARISPTPEEAIRILEFSGDRTKLADAECFLHHILTAVPSAFTRVSAMLFRSNYDADILHLKESLQTLELGCKELRNRGIFFKLLEAILKAGNRMNAGTSRGNAEGFNLAALRKLSDVKSTDGKTTFLHFVVEQVVRSEGKRCMINRNQTLERSKNLINTDNLPNSDKSPEEKEKEYVLLGLPVLAALSVEFINVRKVAGIEYESFINTCSLHTTRMDEIRNLMTDCGGGGDGFVRGMKGFLEECEEELKLVREEQERIMAVVRRTTDYYQARTWKVKDENPLQLFVTVKDFLVMVEGACEDISGKMMRKNGGGIAESTKRSSERFPELGVQVLQHMSRTPSTDSDDF